MTSHQNTEATTATELHEHAAEVDTRIATAYGAYQASRPAIGYAADSARTVAGQRRTYARGGNEWTGTLAEAEAVLPAIATAEPVTYRNDQAADAIACLADARATTADLLAAYQAAEREYAGWSRFFLVTGGHIHATMNCSTCYDTTEFGWLPELSGLTESDAVAVYGSVLCSVCYPSAPVDQVGGKSDGLTLAQRAAAKAEKDAAKAERDAKKAAKNLAEPVRVSHGSRSELVTTIAAAKRLIKEGIDNRAYGYHTFATAEQAETEATLAAILRDRGVDIDTAIAKWTKAAGK